jgi:hypothetical protein
VRDFVFTDQVCERRRVVEPELDMNRFRPSKLSGFSLLCEWLWQRLPGAGRSLRSPMRSVARELEEVWPSGER